MQQCEIHFLDCMGYWDFAFQIISIFIICAIIYNTLRNINDLNNERKDASSIESRKSTIRKLTVHSISFIYQFFLLTSILFSTMIFILCRENMQSARDYKVNLWYKWSEVVFINLLNCLNLTVGLLYWKAVRAFYKISQTPLPIMYFSFVKVIFFLLYVMNFVIISISLFMLLITDQTHYEKYEIKVMNILNAVGVSCSTIVCLTARLSYQKLILNQINTCQTAIKKQKIYSLLIAVTSACRLTCVTLNLSGIDYALSMRNYNQQCLDTTPYHGIAIFLITIFIDLIPPFIFSLIFASQEKRKKSYKEINEYLCKNKESVRYV